MKAITSARWGTEHVTLFYFEHGIISFFRNVDTCLSNHILSYRRRLIYILLLLEMKAYSDILSLLIGFYQSTRLCVTFLELLIC